MAEAGTAEAGTAEAVVQCAVHPDRPGTACSRCGTFGCQDCLVTNDGTPRCRACLARTKAALPPLARRARWARALVLLSGSTQLLMAVVEPGAPRVGAMMALLVLLALLLLVSVVLAPVVFLAWFHLAVRHGLALGLYVEVTAWRAVGGWFIPFVNLVEPFRVARKLCPTARVGLWQALFIIGNASGWASRSPAFSSSLPLTVAMQLIVLAGAVACSGVVRDITAQLSAPPGA